MTELNEDCNKDNECNKILNFWKLEEYFAPSDYPNMRLKVKENKKDVPFDACFKTELPLKNYKRHNKYLKEKNKPDKELCNRVKVYCGRYRIKTFVEKMAEECKLDMEKYAEISELPGWFYIFSVQIDLDGKLIDEGVQISPFFYAVLSMIKAQSININIIQENIDKLNEAVNELLKQDDKKILNYTDVTEVKEIVLDQLGAKNACEIGLESHWNKEYACKGLKKEETSDLFNFYSEDIEKVQKDVENNANVKKYVTAFLSHNQKKIMIDSDVDAMQKWLEVDRFPLAKYPSKFSPTLMQQIAINIAISEKDRNEEIFSVNGPPGTGKTTLLKEIIASNVAQLAEVLIKYGPASGKFAYRQIDSAVNRNEKIQGYYEIPDEIAKYGILVVSNNNGAVENLTLDLPKSGNLKKEKTRTDYFDRKINEEVYFSAVADDILGSKGSSWGLISAPMGKKQNVEKVLNSCVFFAMHDGTNKITLDSAKKDSLSWNEAVAEFKDAKDYVLSLRDGIKKDQKLLADFYKEKENLAHEKLELTKLIETINRLNEELNKIKTELECNEKETLKNKKEIEYIKENSSFFDHLLNYLGIGEMGRHVAGIRKDIKQLIIKHGKMESNKNSVEANREKVSTKIDEKNNLLANLKKGIQLLDKKIYGNNNSLKSKYKNNFEDQNFYDDIKESEESQNACPWTFDEYDRAREALFYAALQVRKAFILESPIIKQNLAVYRDLRKGKFKLAEKQEMFSHLFNALSIVIPVLSSTFASVGTLLKHAGNKSLGMLIVDESGQAVPQYALGAIYRTKRAIVVGDPLQVEPVVTIPQVLIDILADHNGVANEYKAIENSVQTFADLVNEFNGMIGERQVGCPLLVHRRCIEPMFSISNMISYDNRMFNKTNKKEEYLSPEKPFVIKRSGWINVEGQEKGAKDHFVANQAEKVCQLIQRALDIQPDLFKSEEKIFIITPFRTVAESMSKYVKNYFLTKGFDEDMLSTWTKNCIGTVHTFQGKDADEVLMVLGCSDKSVGAMNWVVNKANILNVACTRAKYRIAFIGNIKDWKNRSYFCDFIPKYIDTIDV